MLLKKFQTVLIQAKQKKLVLNGFNINVGHLITASQNKMKVSLDNQAVEQLDGSIKVIQNFMAKNEAIYGVSTGFGGSANTRIKDPKISSEALLTHTVNGFNTCLPSEVVRGMMLLRINSLVRGHSAVRKQVIESLLHAFNAGVAPKVPERGSVSASGDLAPLAYIASFMAGKAYSYAQVPGLKGWVSAKQALQCIGLQPIIFDPKEVLAIVNGTGASTAFSAHNFYRALVVFHLQQALTALAVEALEGSSGSFDEFIHQVRPCPGQNEVAKHIRFMLKGSKLTNQPILSGDLIQDRYALRSSPQWLAPGSNSLLKMFQTIEIEMNSTTDNPLFDYKTNKKYQGANFQAATMGFAMDELRIVLCNLGKLAFAQHSELVNKDLNKGLPPNLAFQEPSIDYGVKGLDIAMAAYCSELSFLSNTITNHVVSAELHNQSVNSLALVSARKTNDALYVLKMMLATHLYSLLQAIDLRIIKQLTLKKLIVYLNSETQVLFGQSIQDLESLVKSELDVNTHWDSNERLSALLSHILGEFMHLNSGITPSAAKMWKDRNLAVCAEIFSKTRETYVEGEFSVEMLGTTNHLYSFVRKDLNIKMYRGDHDQSFGEQIQIIFDAIESQQILGPLMKMFEEDEATKELIQEQSV